MSCINWHFFVPSEFLLFKNHFSVLCICAHLMRKCDQKNIYLTRDSLIVASRRHLEDHMTSSLKKTRNLRILDRSFLRKNLVTLIGWCNAIYWIISLTSDASLLTCIIYYVTVALLSHVCLLSLVCSLDAWKTWLSPSDESNCHMWSTVICFLGAKLHQATHTTSFCLM